MRKILKHPKMGNLKSKEIKKAVEKVAQSNAWDAIEDEFVKTLQTPSQMEYVFEWLKYNYYPPNKKQNYAKKSNASIRKVH